MPLNIKDPVTERLVREVTAITGESKTGAVREALRERKQRLLIARSGALRGDRMVELLEQRLWPDLSDEVRGRPLTREEEDEILGYGPAGA
jgi:antitoxin VapB